MSWRLLPLCLLILGFGWLSDGCGTSEPPVSRDAKGGIELEFWTLQMGSFSSYMRSVIADYERLHPNIHIRWVDVPLSEGEKKALTSMLANRTPDVINLNPDFSALLASRGALIDMDKALPPSAQAAYLPVTWQAASLDGHCFGLPWYLTSAITLYNRSLFQQAGLNGPPQSEAEMAVAAKAFKAHHAGYLLLPTLASGGRFFHTLAKVDIPVWDAQHRLTFADHGADRELAFWVTLFREGAVPREALTEEPQAAIDRYQSRSLGMLLTGASFLNIIRENAPQVYEETDVAPQFPARSQFMDFAEMLLVVPKRSPHPKEAVDFAQFVTNEENTQRLATLAPVLPPSPVELKSIALGVYAAAPSVSDRARAISAQQLLSARATLPVHPMQKRLNELMDYYVQEALLGKMTPQQAMREAQSAMNRLIEGS